MIRIKVKKATTFKEKIIGLIGKKSPYPLFLQTNFGIHTFGVTFPIDILILDKSNRVAVLKKNLLPNRIFLWNPSYSQVLELPQGTIEKEKILLNSQLAIVEEK